jgi:hypothetical protein
MTAGRLCYFLLLGISFGFLFISLELRVISQTRFEWEGNPAFRLFLSGLPWYIIAHFLISLGIACVLSLGFKFFKGLYKKTPTDRLWPIWGLFLLFCDLLMLSCKDK